ncbi:MAG: hypothetical protein AAF611_12165 [Bacteroidota bacterium]
MSITKFSTAQVKSGETQKIDLGSTVINAATAVQGFDNAFSEDHHVRSIDVATSITAISGSVVTVSATCKMRDDSNHEATGTVTVLVIADCEA